MMALESIELPGASLALDPAWLPAAQADALFDALQAGVAWERHRIRLFGREVPAPRLSCWIGDPGTAYRYSGQRHQPRPWPDCLRPVRARLEAGLAASFNSVLANLYRDGCDAMGWHRDDERDLGPAPVIASLSLGAPRRFLVKAHGDPQAKALAIELPHGSLLVMAGGFQRRYRHALPRTARPVGPRINLTFRHVVVDPTGGL
jgi:alkylated DNA repair dioxygenase AlkB